MVIEIAQVQKIHLFSFDLYCIFYNTSQTYVEKVFLIYQISP